MKKLVFGLIAMVMVSNMSFGQENNLKEILKTEKYTIGIRQVENNDDISISFENNLKNFPEFNMNDRYEYDFFENKNKVYSFRQKDYSEKNKSNFTYFL
jgi:hypothetical protein